jgi:hypothetical protein
MTMRILSLLLLVSLLLGCGESASKPPSDAKLKMKLSEASAIDPDLWEQTVATSSILTGIETTVGPPSVSLSVSLYLVRELDRDGADSGFTPDDIVFPQLVSPIELANSISRKPEFPTDASFLLPQYISDLTYTHTGETITGIASFGDGKHFAGKVNFELAFRDGEWTVIRFEMPKSHVHWILGDDGIWSVVYTRPSPPSQPEDTASD